MDARHARPGWAVVVPVKRLALAKSRLPGPAASRAAVALALAQDTVDAAARCPLVAEVLVVTDDERAVAALHLRARVVPDLPRRGLSAAVEYGVALARRADSRRPVAVLTADLPGCSPEGLATVLTAAHGAARCMVADAAGTGTVLLTANGAVGLGAAFGERSRARHTAGGALDLTWRAPGSLRRDIDTVEDLRALLRVPGAERTRAAARAAGWWP
jgi:2-phospho-L-lactate guanylyltransferase